ncbi:MAG: hypothetical protein WBM77_17175 [Maribacter sp.]
MSNQLQPPTPPNSDEIDLGQLFNMFRIGLRNLFGVFLEAYGFLRKNIFLLSGIVVVGLIIGYGLNQIITKKLKTEVIVKPNLESKNYLYDVVNEIQSNIEAEDTVFFGNLGIDVNNLKRFEVVIEAVGVRAKNLEEEMKYLELLQNFENTGIISDIVREEILDKSSLNQRITFFYKDAMIGQDYAKKLMDYINSNEYYNGLVEVQRANARNRIEEDKILLKQVDGIIENYSKNMAQEKVPSVNETFVLDNQERVNITGLFELKNTLIRDIEQKNMELKKNTEAIKVINFGNTQQVQKSFFGKNIVLIPFIMLALFFVISTLKYLNKLDDGTQP